MRQSGNILLALLGAVALIGAIGVSANSLLRGPVRSMHVVTQNTNVTNDLIAAGALLSEYSLSLATADCDGDGVIEPPQWKSAPAGAAPFGGGVLPDTVGVNRRDPWGSDYGYCVWDHGSRSVSDDIADCGGVMANRRAGGPATSGLAIALISSGPDRIFQTSCQDWVDQETRVVDKPAGSDDIVRVLPYGQFLLPRVSSARLEDLADAACTPETIGIMRLSLGVVQACMDTGWEQVGTAAQATDNFLAVTNADLSTQYTSNTISFSGFLGTKNIEMQGDAVLLLNGIATASPTQIVAGDDVALRATSSAISETSSTFSVSISGVKKTWTIRTRDRTPANLQITPPSASGMLVDGESGTAYSSTITFTVRNLGDDKAVLYTPIISGSSNFEVTGNNCAGASLVLNGSCSVTVRGKAAATGAFSGTLNISGAAEYYGGSVSATASLSGDSLFPVTLSSATSVNLAALPEFTANGRWAANRPKRVIVPAATIIGSTAPGVPAVRTGTGRGGTLHMTVNGEVQGAGGLPNSGAGGTAILAEQSGITIVNNGAIRAGGGAGGRGGNGGAGLVITRQPASGFNFIYNNTFWGYGTNGNIYWSGTLIGQVANTSISSISIGGWTYLRGSGAQGAQWSVAREQVSGNAAGGISGNGGRGQGYDGAATNGAASVAGGINAGTSGKSGDGGGWGTSGQTGANGAAGNNGSGTAGTAGGLAGFAIQNFGNVTYSGSGTRQGRI